MRRALLGIGLVACVAGSLIAQDRGGSPAPMRFAVASVRANTSDDGIPFLPTPPDGLAFVNRPLESIIRTAFTFESFRIIGMPEWARTARFDVQAKASRAITAAERRLMLQTLLAERFGLRTHTEMREQSVYVLTRLRPDAPPGAALKPRPDCVAPAKCSGGGSAFPEAGRLAFQAATIDNLAGMMASLLGGIVQNTTNVEGIFDVELTWRPDVASATVAPTESRPSFLTAVEEQLGMKLTPQRRPVEVLVIDELQRPTEN